MTDDTRTMISTTEWTDTEIPRDACREAVAWARTQPDLATAWAACERADWLLWLLGRRLAGLPPEHAERRKLALVAADCAALAEPYWREQDRGVLARCLATVRAWGHGDESVTLADLRAADDAAYDAAYAAACAADDAAYAAACATAYAAATAAAADYAADFARAGIRRQAADIVRRYWPEPPARTQGATDG